MTYMNKKIFKYYAPNKNEHKKFVIQLDECDTSAKNTDIWLDIYIKQFKKRKNDSCIISVKGSDKNGD